jgi:dynein heavy chain 1
MLLHTLQHVVFTMNPRNADFASRSATSPALFNRCVIDWFVVRLLL